MNYKGIKKILLSLVMACTFVFSTGFVTEYTANAQQRHWDRDRDHDRWRHRDRDDWQVRIRRLDRDHTLRYRMSNSRRLVGYYDRLGRFHAYGFYDRFGRFHRL